MSETKVEKRSLRYDFTAIETHDLAIQLAQKTREVSSLEEDKKSVTSQYSAKINEAKATATRLSNLISDGWEFRETECGVEYHVPDQGQKTYTRKDNGKKFTEKMESFEWNLFTQPQEEDHTEDTSATVIEGSKLLPSSDDIEDLEHEDLD